MIIRKIKTKPIDLYEHDRPLVRVSEDIEEIDINATVTDIWYKYMPNTKLSLKEDYPTRYQLHGRIDYFEKGVLKTINFVITMEDLIACKDVNEFLVNFLENIYFTIIKEKKHYMR